MMSSGVPTESGCFCAEVTHDHDADMTASWAGCGERGWCDVAPGCETALETSNGYSGWDHCTPAVPDALRPGSTGQMGADVGLLESIAGPALGLDTLRESGLALVAVGAVAACALHWLTNRAVSSEAPQEEDGYHAAVADPLLEETPCKLDPTANVRANVRMPFQSPTPVQHCIGDTGSASKIPVRRLSEVLTPRQADSPDPALRARFGSSVAKRELSASKQGVQSVEVFCPKNSLPRTPARGLAGLASPASANQQLRFENKDDWLSHHDEGLQLTADYSGGSVPADLDNSVAVEETVEIGEDQDAGMVSSPSSIDSDAPSSPGEEQNGTTDLHADSSAGSGAAPTANWESMAADAGIPLETLESFGKMNAKDLIKQIGSLSTKGAAAVAAFESSHKGRKTVQMAVHKRIETATGAEE